MSIISDLEISKFQGLQLHFRKYEWNEQGDKHHMLGNIQQIVVALLKTSSLEFQKGLI